MQHAFNSENGQKTSMTAAAREVMGAMKELMQSEVNLARTEIKTEVQELKNHVVQLGIFGGLALLGILPLMAFFVTGLGKLLNDRYWLSSLIVAVVCLGVGGLMAMRAIKKMQKQDLSMSRTRASVEYERDVISGKIKDISDETKTRRVA